MRYLPGVRVAGLHPVMWDVMRVMDTECQRLAGRDITITAGTDGKHSDKSRHYVGLAVDARIRDLDGDETLTDNDRALARLLVAECLRVLPPGVVMIVEHNHIHAQFDGAY